MSNHMKTIAYHKYGAPEVLCLEQAEKPSPKDDEVLIRIHATAVSSADCFYRQGKPFVARLFSGPIKPKHPVLGTQFAGEIEAVGKDVSLFKPGDQVYGATGVRMGTYAEYTCLPEDEAICLKPANMTFAEAVGISESACTALPFLRDTGKIKAGQKVLINGASGAVGTSAIQFAKFYGAEVTGVCSTPNLALVTSLGADHVIDYTAQDFTQTGDTYDIIFDAIGKNSFSRCKKALKSGGIYMTTVPSLTILFQMLWTSKFGKKRALFAATGMRKGWKKAKDLAFVKKQVEAGLIKPTLDRVYALEQAAKAHAYVDRGRKKGNVVLAMAGEF